MPVAVATVAGRPTSSVEPCSTAAVRQVRTFGLWVRTLVRTLRVQTSLRMIARRPSCCIRRTEARFPWVAAKPATSARALSSRRSSRCDRQHRAGHEDPAGESRRRPGVSSIRQSTCGVGMLERYLKAVSRSSGVRGARATLESRVQHSHRNRGFRWRVGDSHKQGVIQQAVAGGRGRHSRSSWRTLKTVADFMGVAWAGRGDHSLGGRVSASSGKRDIYGVACAPPGASRRRTQGGTSIHCAEGHPASQ